MKKVWAEGYNGDLDAQTEEITEDQGSHTYPAAAATTTIVSSDAKDDGSPAGVGARTVRVTGLDANFREISEDVVMNGTGAVTLTNQFYRVNFVEVLTVGSEGDPAGNISVKHGSDVIGYIAAGQMTSRSASYCCSANFKNWQVKSFYGTILDATNGSVDFTLHTKKHDAAGWSDRRKITCHGTNRPTEHYKFALPLDLEPGEDVAIVGNTTSNNVVVAGGFDLIGTSKPL